MSLREQLHAYIAQLEQRLRWSTLLRGAAILTGSALVATLVLVTIANALAFSHGSVTVARFALILILAVAAGAGLAAALAPADPPARRGNRRNASSRNSSSASPLRRARRARSFYRTSGRRHAGSRAIRRAEADGHRWPPVELAWRRRRRACVVLIWMIAAGPGFLGYGASLLWTGPHHGKPALYDLRVTPGRCRRAPPCRSVGFGAAHGPAVAQRQVVCALSELREMGRDCDAAEGGRQFRRRLSVSVRRLAGERGVLRDRRSDDVEALQHSRHRSARGEADSRHLSLSRRGPACRRRSRSAAAICARSPAPKPNSKSPPTVRCRAARSSSIAGSRSSSRRSARRPE